MTQCEKIVDYINHFGSITTMEAFVDLGITRLASRIHDLASEGYTIEKTIETGKNRFGESVHYTRYSIIGEKRGVDLSQSAECLPKQ